MNLSLLLPALQALGGNIVPVLLKALSLAGRKHVEAPFRKYFREHVSKAEALELADLYEQAAVKLREGKRGEAAEAMIETVERMVF